MARFPPVQKNWRERERESERKKRIRVWQTLKKIEKKRKERVGNPPQKKSGLAKPMTKEAKWSQHSTSQPCQTGGSGMKERKRNGSGPMRISALDPTVGLTITYSILSRAWKEAGEEGRQGS